MSSENGASMKIISVINYKGGVGKTTLTANLAAELAYQGKRVLLLDMDPQCSLTFSFVSPDVWKDTLSGENNSSDDKTIKRWFDGIVDASLPNLNLHDLIVSNMRVDEYLQNRGGAIDLIPSHLGLINVDLELANMLSGSSMDVVKRNHVKVHGRLRDELKTFAERAEYDVVLIDCPPNFNIVTKNAIVASDHILIPAKPDHLSTLGITYLVRNFEKLTKDFNEFSDNMQVATKILGVIFTMIQIYGGQPISAQRPYMQLQNSNVSIFATSFRENKSIFSSAPQDCVPVVLQSYNAGTHSDIVAEIKKVAAEFCKKAGV